ncbi:MAG TPA: AtzE family amidohydrolase [Casimicrobiaceae bacterium]|jgi:aspartyl-tRNA(Asn)/glutamyl-tRNA(Gln) amidotransferase subunit A|nr:AtzE family amidohydrolase [Casimicrobiaceae bacterium]
MKSALEIARGVRGGTLRAVDVIAGTLARIDALDAEINAFTSRLDAKARCDATAIDDAIAAGRDPGPLAGVPFAVKNLYDIAGVTTIAGARIHAQRPPAARDATLVQRLKASGAILVGAVNMDAYAYGFTTENTHYGATRNPHDTRLTAGGSSGGSAAAVAAAMVPLTLGSDTNGSIRVPASFCGVFGLRPTFGRLSRTGTLPFVHDLDVLGPFAASAADLALAYDATCGPDQEDPVCSERDWTPLGPTLAQGIDGLRIAVCDGFFEHPLDPHARSAVQLAASALGAKRRITIAEAERARAAAFVLTASAAGSLYLDNLKARADDFEPLSRDRLLAGALVPAAWVHRAQRFRRWYHAALLSLFDSVDALIAPATPCPAFALGTETLAFDGVSMAARPNVGIFTQPISFAGVPVAAVPMAIDGPLPVAVQVIAAPWCEHVCLRVAAELERCGSARAWVRS